jgi:membrane protein YqaA with SNARE-associated domain
MTLFYFLLGALTGGLVTWLICYWYFRAEAQIRSTTNGPPRKGYL